MVFRGYQYNKFLPELNCVIFLPIFWTLRARFMLKVYEHKLRLKQTWYKIIFRTNNIASIEVGNQLSKRMCSIYQLKVSKKTSICLTTQRISTQCKEYNPKGISQIQMEYTLRTPEREPVSTTFFIEIKKLTILVIVTDRLLQSFLGDSFFIRRRVQLGEERMRWASVLCTHPTYLCLLLCHLPPNTIGKISPLHRISSSVGVTHLCQI